MCILEKVLWARFAEVVKQYWVCTVTKPKVVLAVIVTILFIRLAVKNPDQTGSAYRSCEPWKVKTFHLMLKNIYHYKSQKMKNENEI